MMYNPSHLVIKVDVQPNRPSSSLHKPNLGSYFFQIIVEASPTAFVSKKNDGKNVVKKQDMLISRAKWDFWHIDGLMITYSHLPSLFGKY